MKRFFSLLLLLLAAVVLVACNGDEVDPTPEKVTLDVAIHYAAQGELFPITYRRAEPYVSSVNGKTYSQGDLTPVWEAIAEIADVTFNDVASDADTNTNAQWERLISDGFAGVDLVNGTGQNIGPAGVDGGFVDLGQHLNKMPNLKALLEANPALNQALRMGDGGLYFTPYFDGLNEIEHMYLARIDWIEKVLDFENADVLSTTPYTVGDNYELQALSNEYEVTVANADGTTRVVNKERTENPVTLLRNLEGAEPGSLPTGKDLAVAFVNYLEDTYGEGHGYAKLSHIFAGTDASYDTDELMALMHVIKANASYLLEGTGSTTLDLYFPRETKGNRVRQMFRGMEMFGLRGVNSRLQWTYIDTGNVLKDVRGDDVDEFIAGVNNLSNMVKDGLIMDDVVNFPVQNIRKSVLNGENNRLAFLTYDFNASSTVFGDLTKDPDFKFQAILPPVVDWRGNGEYFHFSESNRSIKNEAWGIPSHVANNPDKLEKALLIVDGMFDYSKVDSIGNIHLYGPAGWNTGKFIDYGTDKVLELSDAFFAEMSEFKVSHIDYLRRYLGATMPIGHVRSMGLEYQTLTQDGKEGIERINTAVAAGVLKLAGLVDSTDEWYSIVPTFLPFDEAENNTITANGVWRDHVNDDSLLSLMNNGFSGSDNTPTAAQFKADLNEQYENYIDAFRAAFQRSLDNA